MPPREIIFLAPSISSIYAIASLLSPGILLFKVLGSGLIAANSPLKVIAEGSLVLNPGRRFTIFVRNLDGISVVKSTPNIELFVGSSPILTLSLRVSCFRFT